MFAGSLSYETLSLEVAGIGKRYSFTFKLPPPDDGVKFKRLEIFHCWGDCQDVRIDENISSILL